MAKSLDLHYKEEEAKELTYGVSLGLQAENKGCDHKWLEYNHETQEHRCLECGLVLLPEDLEEEEKESKLKICPRCNDLGYGLYKKWVLNEQGTKYYPYYWMAHKIHTKDEHRLKWCYIRKKQALEILKEERRAKMKKGSFPSLLEQQPATPLESEKPFVQTVVQSSTNTEQNIQSQEES